MFRVPLIALAIVLAPAPAVAQDRPMLAPAGQGRSGPSSEPAADPPPAPRRDESGPREETPAEADDREQLERARAAARAADPRLQGIERARAAARSVDAGGGKDCMSARDARGAIAAKRAVSLSQALRTARGAWDGEVIDYRLCTFDGSLAYDLTLLNDDGRVARVRVEAASGKLVGVR